MSYLGLSVNVTYTKADAAKKGKTGFPITTDSKIVI